MSVLSVCKLNEGLGAHLTASPKVNNSSKKLASSCYPKATNFKSIMKYFLVFNSSVF